MFTEEKARELLNPLKEPFLHISLADLNAIEEVKVKEEKNHVSVKIAIAKTGTAEQLQFQTQIVDLLKGAGANTVGIRFSELPAEVLEKHRSAEPKQAKNLLSKDSETTFIAIASGKGGVGKSTVSVNLAVSLARAGKKVGLVDADIYGFSVPDMMGITDRPTVNNEQKLIPVDRFGVKVISMGFFVEDNSPIIWRGPMLGKVLNQFFNDVEWGELDYLLLDLPPGTGDVALDLHTMLPTCKEIIVTTPHPTAAFVAARAGVMALKTDHEILGVIENMSYFESKVTGEKEYVFGQGGGDKLAEVLKTEVLGRLPLAQPDLNEEDFAPSVYQEDHQLGKVYGEIAHKMIQVIG
jgi:ATP-binding protein involved in chromosome partitioning